MIGRAERQEVEAALKRALEDWLLRTGNPIADGVVPAPVGYWEHFCQAGRAGRPTFRKAS